jgi:microcystin-dependent protein
MSGIEPADPNRRQGEKMSTPYIGQLMLVSFNFAPRNFAACNGQLLAISSNQALFSVLGTFYGGNGVQTFALPNLQGRTPVGFNNSFNIGQIGGEDFHTLNQNEVPGHTHQLNGTSTPASSQDPIGNVFAVAAGINPYALPNGAQPMMSGAISSFGGSQSHENRQPFLVMNWIIALSGIFPSRN